MRCMITASLRATATCNCQSRPSNGNAADCTTLRMSLAGIERQSGRARRVWAMDRGIPTGAVLAEMRARGPPVQCLVGTPKGRGT